MLHDQWQTIIEKHQTQLYMSAVVEFEDETMADKVNEIRGESRSKWIDLTDTGVSVDGTWQRCQFSSTNWNVCFLFSYFALVYMML